LGHNPLAHLRREAYKSGNTGYPAASLALATNPAADRNVSDVEATIRHVLKSTPGH
jgi:hypothetical protein